MLITINDTCPLIRLATSVFIARFLGDEVTREGLLSCEFNRSEWNLKFSIGQMFGVSVIIVHYEIESLLFFIYLFISQSFAEWFLVLESCLDFSDGLGDISNNALVGLLFKQGE